MNSRWDDRSAQDAVRRWGPNVGENMALRLYTARLIGQEGDLVLHGGGNVSVKGTQRTVLGEGVEAIHVKASGQDLASIEPAGLPALDLVHLRRLRQLDSLDDDAMVNEFRRHLFDASALTPSIEALVHAFLPHRYVDHSHADAVLALTNQPDDRLVREALGDRVAVLPYVTPGFELARGVADLYEADPDVEGMVLLHHGLITFGDDARSSYERHISLVDACERFIEQRVAGRGLTVAFKAPAQPPELAAAVAPVLRGVLAVPTASEDQPYRRSILEWRCGQDVVAFVNSTEARELAKTGPLTCDHLIRTKPWPLFVENPAWADQQELRRQLEQAVNEYRDQYQAYVAEHGGTIDGIDLSPRVVLLPGAGAFCWGPTKGEAHIAADITEHTLAAKARAQAVGAYAALSLAHLFAMEYRSLQLAKLDRAADRPLEGQVVVVSGGAGAIGSAVAQGCADAGAHVAVTDLDADGLARVVRRVEQHSGVGTATAVVMDVTDETSVRRGFEEICRFYGGVDVLVPNAGVAHVAPIEELTLADFRRVMEVNATGYLLFMREGIGILKRQGLGGHIVINSSKNVFGPGKDFGAYSASKAAGHQLGKVAAIELAPYGIRVNMINADAVFGHEDTPSGLWAEVGPQRAKSRGMKPEDLPEYYRSRNLLKARVLGHHVANAVVFFASNATPTTGATLPVDGGVIEAFPR